jgi:hypothetical protein
MKMKSGILQNSKSYVIMKYPKKSVYIWISDIPGKLISELSLGMPTGASGSALIGDKHSIACTKLSKKLQAPVFATGLSEEIEDEIYEIVVSL